MASSSCDSTNQKTELLALVGGTSSVWKYPSKRR